MTVAVILNILKIIGIVLACVVGFVLLLVILVLFVPVRYKVGFVRTGLDTDPPVDAQGYAGWLLHILHVSAYFPDHKGYNLIVRVFGIPVYKKSFTAKDKQDMEDAQKKALNKQAKKQIDKIESVKDTEDAESDPANAQEDLTAEQNEDQSKYQTSDQIEDQTADNVSEEQNKSIFSRIRDFLNKIAYTIRTTCDKIKNSLENFADKTEAIKKDIHYYHTILTSDLFEREFEKIRKKLLKLLKELRPNKCDIRIEAGFDDPYTTGEVLAIAGALYPVLGQYVHVTGNFEEVIIRGAGKIKGRIFIFSFVKLVIWYFTDKDLKKLIRLFKKEPPKGKRKKVNEEAG